MGALPPDTNFKLNPLGPDDAGAVLEVYRQCEDFLAFGPEPLASLAMVLQDMEASRQAGGIFCGIYTNVGRLIGVVDYLPTGYQGDPQCACLYLLMIAAPFRSQGLGQAVVAAVEQVIRANQRVTAIRCGVQINNPRAVQFWLNQGYRITSDPQLMPDQTTVYGLLKAL